MKLSIIIPARNEEAHLLETIKDIQNVTTRENVPLEIVIVLDQCTDKTEEKLLKHQKEHSNILIIKTKPESSGIGNAINLGILNYTGDCVAIMMADASDSAEDAVAYYRKLSEGYDCVFGTRFSKGGKTIDYPKIKLVVNRIANSFIKILFQIPLDDTTNAFKAYRRETIDGILPIISHHFNITVELPLKAIVRGYNYTIIPITWTNRKHGISKLKMQEMGGRYLFICLYLWLEKKLARKDYQKKQ